jgi:hypothetical protein
LKNILEGSVIICCWELIPDTVHIAMILWGKCKAIPLQALTGPEDSRRLRLPDFKTIGT